MADTNLRFADGVDALAEEELELEAQATQMMKNSANDIQREIKVKWQKLGTVTSFKYHRTVVLDDGFKPEVFSRIHKPLNLLQRKTTDSNFLLGHCKSWTVTVELKKKAGLWDEMILNVIKHFVQGPISQSGVAEISKQPLKTLMSCGPQ